MDWKTAILGLSGILALAGIAVFLLIAGKKWGESEEEKAKRRRAEADARALVEAVAAQRERENRHVERIKDIIRRVDDIEPLEFERMLNSYPPENRATQTAGSRRDSN